MDFGNTHASFIILLANLIISLYTLYGNQSLFEKLLLHPYSVIHYRQWYRMISSGFIHADLTHLLFNMVTFFFFAFTLEQTVGTTQFLIIYFFSLILSCVWALIKNKDNWGYRAVGASGAISGVLFSYILFYPEAKIAMFFFPIGIPSPIFGVLYLAYCWYAAKKSNDNISHETHFWGAVVGIVFTIILFPGILEEFLSKVF